MSKKLVRLWKRPCKGGQEFRYVLIWTDEQCKERWKALGHADSRKAERQRAQMERELRMGLVEPASMRLSKFLEDSLARTRGQVRETTLSEYDSAMRHFIRVVGDIDYQQVKHNHGERFMQASRDSGNAPATSRKKIRTLKRLFQLAVERGQIESNPFRYVRQPKVPKRPVHVFRDDECARLIKAARESGIGSPFRWDLLIMTALCTGMRRGELLNLTWQDIDFERKVVEVSPKQNTDYTWEWHIKDTDRRTLPLTDELVDLLAQHQTEQPDGYPYVFIPPFRYDYIQSARRQGKWTVRQGNYSLNNFDRQFRSLLKRAGIERGEFHDFRRTCLTQWFANGLREYDVTHMAGHANFETTHSFYLAVSDTLLERTRAASSKAMKEISIANSLQPLSQGVNKKSCQSQTTDSIEFNSCARQDSNL